MAAVKSLTTTMKQHSQTKYICVKGQTHMCSCVCPFFCSTFVWVIEYVVERSTAHSSHKIQIWEQTEWNVIIAKHTHECPHKYLYSLPLFILTLLLSLSYGHTSTNPRRFDWDWMCVLYLCHLFYCWLHKMYIFQLKWISLLLPPPFAVVFDMCLKQKKRVHEKSESSAIIMHKWI